MDVQQKINAGAYKNDVPYTKDTRAEYSKREAELLAQFWGDVEAEYREPWHRQAQWDRMTAFAWDHGHASGLNDVLYWMNELVELIEP